MPEALAIVKVGNSECELVKLIPLSRIAAIVGAVSAVTFSARRPSGTNRMTFLGWLFCAKAADTDNPKSPADRAVINVRIKLSFLVAGAFSSEVGTGSREENATLKV